MAGKGGLRSTSFKAGEAKGKPKGATHKSTKIKRALGVTNWEELGRWMENEGIAKYIANMESMKPKDYMTAYSTLLEYIKPKLNRTTLVGDADQPIIWSEQKTYVQPTPNSDESID